MRPERGPLRVATVDYHTAGEPFRIVTGGVPPLRGRTILEKRAHAAAHLDHYRQLLVNEPRGHADMYGCFVTEPEDDGADLGVVFFHNAGYSTACGHGTIALVTWAIESGFLPGEGSQRDVMVDVPSGRLATSARVEDERVSAVGFRNVPAWVHTNDLELTTSAGPVRVDVAYGGAFYASVRAADLDLRIQPERLGRFIELGRELKAQVEGAVKVVHPESPELEGIYGVIFHEGIDTDGPELTQRNVTVFADGEVDRSPCGSGTSARLALLDARGELGRGETLIHEGILGTRFVARVVDAAVVAGQPAVVTAVSGSASLTGFHQFVLDPADELGTGFKLR